MAGPALAEEKLHVYRTVWGEDRKSSRHPRTETGRPLEAGALTDWTLPPAKEGGPEGREGYIKEGCARSVTSVGSPCCQAH